MTVKLVIIVVVVILALVALVVVAGVRAPVRHVARVSTSLGTRASEVWPVVADLGAWPTWNKRIARMERKPDKDGHPVWSLAWKGEEMPSEILESTAPTATSPGRLVTRIADPSLPFGGTWTWEIADDNGRTRVVLTEDGHIDNTIFRGMSALFFGYTGTQHGYLGALAERFGEKSPTFDERVDFPST